MYCLVSICVPNYNGAKFIERTIRSILAQTYKNIEIIVGDNCSDDNSLEIVKRLMLEDERLRYIKHAQNIGFPANCNRLIEASNGAYITMYHADDLYEPKIVEEQVRFLEKNLDVGGVFTGVQVIDENDFKIIKAPSLLDKFKQPEIILDLDLFLTYFLRDGENICACPSIMMRREVYLYTRGYNEGIRIIEDLDMWIRTLEKYKLGVINKKLLNYRKHRNQGSFFYTNLHSEEFLPSTEYLITYFDKHFELKEKYQEYLAMMIARNYLRMVKNNIILGDKKQIEKFIDLSKQYYKFKFLSKDGLTQYAHISLIALFLRFILKKNRNIV